MLDHKTSFSKFKVNQVTKILLSDQYVIKLKINNRKISGKSSNI